MLHHAVLIQNLIEHTQRSAPVDHVVLRDNLKPVDNRLLRKDVLVVRDAKPDANAVFGKSIKTICRHSGIQFVFCRLDYISHSKVTASTQVVSGAEDSAGPSFKKSSIFACSRVLYPTGSSKTRSSAVRIRMLCTESITAEQI